LNASEFTPFDVPTAVSSVGSFAITVDFALGKIKSAAIVIGFRTFVGIEKRLNRHS
jgi:hypothetical protein